MFQISFVTSCLFLVLLISSSSAFCGDNQQKRNSDNPLEAPKAKITRVARRPSYPLSPSRDWNKFGIIHDFEEFVRLQPKFAEVDMDDSVTGIIPAGQGYLYTGGISTCYALVFRGYNPFGRLVHLGLYHDSNSFRGTEKEGSLRKFIGNFLERSPQVLSTVQILMAGGMSLTDLNAENTANAALAEAVQELGDYQIRVEMGELFIDPTGYPKKFDNLSRSEKREIETVFDDLVELIGGIGVIVDPMGNAYIDQYSTYLKGAGSVFGDFLAVLVRVRNLDEMTHYISQLSRPELERLQHTLELNWPDAMFQASIEKLWGNRMGMHGLATERFFENLIESRINILQFLASDGKV
jgi:hypothetical protein